MIERVECAEADILGRRRGDEYREAEKRNAGGGPVVVDDPLEDWVSRADQAPAALSAVIATKIGKRYAGRASLLINLNISEFGHSTNRNRSRHDASCRARPGLF